MALTHAQHAKLDKMGGWEESEGREETKGTHPGAKVVGILGRAEGPFTGGAPVEVPLIELANGSFRTLKPTGKVTRLVNDPRA